MIADGSYYNRPIPFAALRAAGIDCFMARGPLGDRWVDDDYHTNWTMARTFSRQGVYCDLIYGQSGAAQALNILHQTGADFGTEAVALDVERTEAERKAIQAGTLVWDKAAYTAMLKAVVDGLTPVHPVRLYTSKVEWEAMTTQPEWAKSMLNWIAHYNSHITAPDVPAGWRWGWWQFGQQLFNGKPIDVSRENVSMPTLSPGAGHGFHGEQTNQIIPIIKRGLALGYHFKVLNSVHNPGRCVDAANLDPAINTICRFKFPHTPIGERWENGQDVERWDAAEHLACAKAQIQLIFDNTNPTERAKVKRYTPGINEWNLDNELSNWTCVGEHLHLMMDECARREQEFGFPLRLAVPGISQGKPEYHQMVEMVKTGCFDRMRERGDHFTVHAGRFAWQDSPEIPGLGVVIPGALYCPPYSGAYDGRINYFYDLGVACDFDITEAYDGYDKNTPPALRLVRMKQADDLYRHNPHYRGICWFEEVDGPGEWNNTDFTPTMQWPGFEQEMLAQANVPNPTGETEMQPLYHSKALIDLAIRDAAGNPTTDPVGNPPASPGLAGVVPAGRQVHVYQVGVTAGPYSNRAVINPNGANIWGIPTALQKI